MTSNADLQKIAERLLVDPRAKVQRDKTQGNTEGKDLKMEEVLQSKGTSIMAVELLKTKAEFASKEKQFNTRQFRKCGAIAGNHQSEIPSS